MRANGAVVSAETLLETAWDEHTDPFTTVVRERKAEMDARADALFDVAKTTAEAVDLAGSGPDPIGGRVDGRGASVDEAAVEDWTAAPGDPAPGRSGDATVER